MAYRKNYSNSEYEKFLKQDFSSNFGISKENSQMLILQVPLLKDMVYLKHGLKVQ